MKRIISLLLLACIALSVLAGCESPEQKLEREVESVYFGVGPISFSDESVLTPDELGALKELKDLKEKAYRDKDIPALQKVKSDWDAFRAPIQTRISEIEAEARRIAEEAAQKAEEEAQVAIQKALEDAKSIADTLTAFSFGTFTLSISSRNHSIVYSYKYNIDVGNADMLKSSLETSTNLLASTFQLSVNALKDAGVSSPSVIVEYKDSNGNTIYSKEFK